MTPADRDSVTVHRRLRRSVATLFAANSALLAGLVVGLVAGLMLHPRRQHTLHRVHMETDDE